MKKQLILIIVSLLSINAFSQQISIKNLSNGLNKKALNLTEFKTLGYTFKNKKLIGVSKDTISLSMGWIMWKGKDEQIFKNLETEMNSFEQQDYNIYNDSKTEKRYAKTVIKNGLTFTINKNYTNNNLNYFTVEIMNDQYGSDGE